MRGACPLLVLREWQGIEEIERRTTIGIDTYTMLIDKGHWLSLF
jgi:hypothetical protein